MSDEGTPGPIPNPEVKLVSADGTWRAASWESRSLPRNFFFLMEAVSRPAKPVDENPARVAIARQIKRVGHQSAAQVAARSKKT